MAAVAAPIAVAVPVATLAYLVFKRHRRGPEAEAEQRKEKEGEYGDLDSLVSFSSRVIAAARAVESERADAFVRDPLAEALAGPKALQVARARVAAAAADADPGATSTPQTPRAVPRLVMRTVFLDDAVVLAACGGVAPQRQLSTPSAAQALAPLAEFVRESAARPEAPPVHTLQVVLLGAGMDARPWRLPLPPGRVRWIEVDRADVIRAKKRALQAAGAEVPGVVEVAAATRASGSKGGRPPRPPAAPAMVPPPTPPPPPRPSGPASVRSLQRSASAAAAAAALAAVAEADAADSAPVAPTPTFPLRAATWAGVAADLTKPGWAAALSRDAAFDPRIPTLWVAEGLLYYLDPATVPEMFREAASVSAPGSALVATVITDATLEAMKGGGGGKAGADGPSTAAPKANDALSAALSSGPGLTSQFVWGAPAADVDGYFARSGWRVLQRPTWSRAAEAYGWRAERRAGTRVPAEAQVQFLVAGVVVEGEAAGKR